MSRLYSSPLRVYLCLGLLALAGILAGLKLPVSLFPNSSRPLIGIWITYGNTTADEFLNSYGRDLEYQLRSISTGELRVEEVQASYHSDGVSYRLQFAWGAPPRAALREVEMVANSYGARFPSEIRDSMNVWMSRDNSGFFALSFYSSKRSLDELYDLLEPLLAPKLSKVQDAEEPELWNPTRKEIRIELIPETMAALQLLPKDVDQALNAALRGHGGGSLTVGTNHLMVQMPRKAISLEDLGRIGVLTPAGRMVHLSDLARIDMGPRTTHTKSFKTSGAPSLILFAKPRPDGNVKRMSEEMLAIVREVAPSFPSDVEYRVLVDPSEFIRAAIDNVSHEVLIGALLAVAVLFVFIGSLRNTVTAAIEIPLSMVLAFILMKFSGMNLNLISLGGLALSAGMNVDASIVVMENIFRHFEKVKGPIGFQEKLSIISQAVREVRFSVIAATIASLVVFIPLAFTSDLSYAILGDLAKTVVFSHGFSAIVALILVPTVRLHLMRKGNDRPPRSPIEGKLKRLEAWYGKTLEGFLSSRRARTVAFGGIAATLVVLLAFVLPRLPKEIIGKPDTDWMILGIETRGHTLIRQMESVAEEVEARLLQRVGDKVQYTFNQVVGLNRAFLMARLKNKSDMQSVWKDLEAHFTNTPFVEHWVEPWNPAELPIPDPPHLRVVVRGGDLETRADVAQRLNDLLETHKAFPRIWTRPNPGYRESVSLHPHLEQWSALWNSGSRILPGDLADLARVASEGRKATELPIKGRPMPIMLRYPETAVPDVEALAALPIGIGQKIVPLKALADVRVEKEPPNVYREDGRELFVVAGKQTEATKSQAAASRVKAESLIQNWIREHAPGESGVSVYLEDAEKDLNGALRQLSLAVGLSILLIFLTMVIQFGSAMDALLVLVSVPLGIIGVLLSLFVFGSTLSLNSVLGVILLNGIAVANSIILVDFMKRRVREGMPPRQAAVVAARTRLRPILITSLTTVLGMLPIALGFGEGGRILQPLGIAVSGGLWVSMGLTLFVVPALQVAYLEWRIARGARLATTLEIAESNQAAAQSPLQPETLIAPPRGAFLSGHRRGLNTEALNKLLSKLRKSRSVSSPTSTRGPLQ